jgi:hypothetical protein
VRSSSPSQSVGRLSIGVIISGKSVYMRRAGVGLNLPPARAFLPPNSLSKLNSHAAILLQYP